MTDNVKKVFACLLKKRTVDEYMHEAEIGWLKIKDIQARCGFEKAATATGCVVSLVSKGIAESREVVGLDNKMQRYYRLKEDVNVTLSYSFNGKIIADAETLAKDF